ncbi:MAG TPA: hypothetical protein VMZ53_21775 [Kofleriaceae bacterium]|nr:hypothetical protein [Kofleriaceae bacterium]
MASLWQQNLRITWWLGCGAALIFLVVLPVYACSGCDIRKRSEKRACREGNVDACLAVGRYYEGKSDGLFAMVLSNGATSTEAYARACKLGSAIGCERAAFMSMHADNARDPAYTHRDAAHDFASACVDGIDEACAELDDFYGDLINGTLAEDVASRYFLDRCRKDNVGAACYRFGIFMKTPHSKGEVKPNPELEQQMYKEACAKGYKPGCSASR